MAEKEIQTPPKSKSTHDSENDVQDEVTPWRRKFILTLCLFSTFIVMGCGNAIYGATLLDLAAITNTSVAKISWILTGRSLGGLVGAFLLPFVLKRFTHWAPLAVAQLVCAVVLFIVPWCSQFPLMVGVIVLYGLSRSYVAVACITAVIDIWGLDNGPWLSALFAMMGIGSLIMPLVVKLFTPEISYSINETEMERNFTSIIAETSQVYIPYTITGTLHLLTAILLALAAIIVYKLWYIKSHMPRKDKKDTIKEGDLPKEGNNLKKRLYKIFSWTKSFEGIVSVLLTMFLFCSILIEFTMAMFLVTFVAQYLKWSKNNAMLVLSAFFIGFTLSRGITAILFKFLNAKFILLISVILNLTSCATLALALHIHTSVIWVTVIGIGLGSAGLYPVALSYINQYIPVGPMIMTAGQGATAVAAITSPFIFGALYDSSGPILFVHMLVTASSSLVAIYICIFILLQRHGERIDVSVVKVYAK